MGKLIINKKKITARCILLTIVLAFFILLPASAQQQASQQRQSTLQREAAPGLPASCTTAAYTQDGGEEIHIGKTYSSTKADVIESVVFVKNGGWLTMISPKLSKTGNKDKGEFGGQGVEAAGGSVVNILDGEIYTDTQGGNGLWATDEGSLIYMKGGSITTLESSGHGVDTTNRASIILYDVEILTSGQSASGALVNDSGDGTVYATRVKAHTKGPGSPGFYMIGTLSMLTVKDSTLEAETSDAGVLLNGSNVSVTNSTLIGGKGVKIIGGTFTMTGGSLTATGSDAFYVGGASGPDRVVPGGSALAGTQGGASGGAPGGMAAGGAPGGMAAGGAPGAVPGDFRPPQVSSSITLKDGVKISTSTGNIVNVAEALEATFTAEDTDLKGDMVVVEKGELTVTLSKSSLTGAIQGAALRLDKDSKWHVTGDSILTSLSNADGISGRSITNILGNGYTVYYDKKLDENKALGGKTYTLSNGGKLTPQK